MIFKLFALFIVLSFTIYIYLNIEQKILTLKQNLSSVFTKVNTTKKGLEEFSQKMQEDEGSKISVLGIKTPQITEINNLKIDYSQGNLKVALNPIELENIDPLKDSFEIKVFVTDLKSEKSIIEDKYITVNTEFASDKGYFKIVKGNPLKIYYKGSKESRLNSLTINPVLEINLPPGVYKGTYTGKLYIENN